MVISRLRAGKRSCLARGAKGEVGGREIAGPSEGQGQQRGTHLQFVGLGMCVAFDENFLVVKLSTTAFGL